MASNSTNSADDALAKAEQADTTDDDSHETADVNAADPDQTVTTGRRMSGARVAALAGAAVLLCALLVASGFMLWQGHQASERRAQEAAFAAAARQGVVNLMSLDFNKGDEDIKRLIDSTTGEFRADFEKTQNDFLAAMMGSKVVTRADVKATGIESMKKDSAVVLVTASSEVSNAVSAKQAPRGWRLSVTVERDAGQLKMSKVEFVP